MCRPDLCWLQTSKCHAGTGTGAAALLMQYGIVEGRDPYLYGEKVRVSLVRGARRLPFQQTQPSPLVGWGALCVADSLPE